MTRFESLQRQLAERNVSVAFIAGQKKEGPLGAGGYFKKNPLSFPFLLDRKRETIKAYGVYRPVGLDGVHTAHPSTFVIDASGRVAWIYVGKNQQDRPDPAEVLQQIEKL